MKLDFLQEQVSSDRIENGAWYHFVSHLTGEPLYLDPRPDNPVPGQTYETQPCRGLIRSVNSKAFRDCEDRIRKRINNARSRAKPSQQSKVIDAEGDLERPKKLAVLIVQLENVSRANPGPQPPPTDEEARDICDDSTVQWWVDQVFLAAADDERYGGADAVKATVKNVAGQTEES